MADATLANDFNGLLRASLANPSKIKPERPITTPADDMKENDTVVLTHSVTPTLMRGEIPTPAATHDDRYAMDGNSYGCGKPEKRAKCTTQCYAPEPSHGG